MFYSVYLNTNSCQMRTLFCMYSILLYLIKKIFPRSMFDVVHKCMFPGIKFNSGIIQLISDKKYIRIAEIVHL